MTSLTKNFSLEELTASPTAKAHGIDNTPNAQVIKNLRVLAEKILQPLRDAYGLPIIVSSGYRCSRLNTLIGGATNSDHMFGCAADIKTKDDTPVRNRILFNLAVKMMREGTIKDVKQIIDEKGYDWIHISFQDGRSAKRNQILHLK